MYRPLRHLRTLAAASSAAVVSFAGSAPAQVLLDSLPETEGVEVLDRRGAELPRGLVFKDGLGNEVRSDDFFDGKRPVILVLAYYDCPLLCSLVLNNLQQTLNELKWTLGEDYRVVTVSFDHTNTPAQAREKQALYLAGYRDEQVEPDAWRFLIGDAKNVRALADSVGFVYRFLPDSGEFSHPSAIFFASPKGTLTGFIENLEFPADQTNLALMDAADGKLGSLFDRVAFTCYMYDPKTGRYVIHPMRVMQIGGGVTLVCLGAFLGVMFFAGRSRRRAVARAAAPARSTRSTPSRAQDSPPSPAVS